MLATTSYLWLIAFSLDAKAFVDSIAIAPRAGILLVTLGVVHLVATPHIASFGSTLSFLPLLRGGSRPPMLLNHILVECS